MLFYYILISLCTKKIKREACDDRRQRRICKKTIVDDFNTTIIEEPIWYGRDGKKEEKGRLGEIVGGTFPDHWVDCRRREATRKPKDEEKRGKKIICCEYDERRD